jgi:hypothetical protein
VTAIDAPPGLGLGGRPLGEFGSRPGPRRLAQLAFRVSLVAGALTFALIRHRHAHQATFAVLALTCVAFTSVGLAVRRARVAIDPDGVRWGWAWAGFRMGRARLVRADVFDDGVGLVSKRGSWFLSARDWDRFDALVRAIGRAGMPTISHPNRAPLRARLQSYGRVLDTLLIVTMAAAAAILGAAAAA